MWRDVNGIYGEPDLLSHHVVNVFDYLASSSISHAQPRRAAPPAYLRQYRSNVDLICDRKLPQADLELFVYKEDGLGCVEDAVDRGVSWHTASSLLQRCRTRQGSSSKAGFASLS